MATVKSALFVRTILSLLETLATKLQMLRMLTWLMVRRKLQRCGCGVMSANKHCRSHTFKPAHIVGKHERTAKTTSKPFHFRMTSARQPVSVGPVSLLKHITAAWNISMFDESVSFLDHHRTVSFKHECIIPGWQTLSIQSWSPEGHSYWPWRSQPFHHWHSKGETSHLSSGISSHLLNELVQCFVKTFVIISQCTMYDPQWCISTADMITASLWGSQHQIMNPTLLIATKSNISDHHELLFKQRTITPASQCTRPDITWTTLHLSPP